jgi:perosamine synthetase
LQYPSDQDISGRTFGAEELNYVTQALKSGVLIGGKGQFVRRLELRFQELLDVDQVWACASGTAALHTAIATLDLEPGSEVIVSPITDMGALTPILFQGCIPIFADVDPCTGLVTPRSIEDRVTSRTRAIVVTHLFGQCKDMSAIAHLAESKGLYLIEDCAQAYLASDEGKLAGTWGQLAVFSLQQGKHASCGEGGLLVVNEPSMARRAFLFINKAWGYGDAKPDHAFAALNYRMNELSAAVALAQVEKLESCVTSRRASAAPVCDALVDLGYALTFPRTALHSHAQWRVAFHTRRNAHLSMTATQERLTQASVPHQAGYIRKPAFECAVFRAQATLGRSRWPLSLQPNWGPRHVATNFPGAAEFLESVIVLGWNERYTREHAVEIARALRADAALANWDAPENPKQRSARAA